MPPRVAPTGVGWSGSGGGGGEREERAQQINAAINRLLEAKKLVTQSMQQREARGDEAETEEEAEGKPLMSESLQDLIAADKHLTELLRKYRCQEPWYVELLRKMGGKLPRSPDEEDQKGAPLTPAAAREQFDEHREGVEKVRHLNEEIAAMNLDAQEMVTAELDYHDVLHPAARQHARALRAFSRRLVPLKPVTEALRVAVDIETYLETWAGFLQ